MNETLRQNISNFVVEQFASKIKDKLTKGHSLSSFNVNPIVLTALASGVLGDNSAQNMAKVLLYPRVFGTSISTTFGDRMQTLCVKYLGATASGIPGMDIEFEDHIDGGRVIMQLKAGPNTINAGDVKPIIDEMSSAYRLQVQNKVQVIPTFAVGVTYGNVHMLSSHYKKIMASNVAGQTGVPIFVGKDFWHRLSGVDTFYDQLINIFIEVFESQNYSTLLQTDLDLLASEIENKYFTNNRFDLNKI